jgi:hypothetical protein
MPKPMSLRQLKAEMVLKGLSLREVSERSKVEYRRCSEILNGHRNDLVRLTKIERAIRTAPTHPEEVAL